MNDLLTYMRSQQDSMVGFLRQLVNIESQTEDKTGVDEVGRLLASRLVNLGATISSFEQTTAGNHLLGVLGGGKGSPIAMILHMDTVHPAGTLARRPTRIVDGCFYGPGAYDMKGSHVIAIYALRALRALNLMPSREIRILFTSDEETGSHTSRPLIEQAARDAALAMVMEPALPDGRLKSSRKGVGDFRVTAHGRASHAGAEHQKGINAIHEIALQVAKIQALTDYERGVTFSVGDIRGGGIVNVVPDRASILVDTRAATLRDAEWITRQLYGLKPLLPGAALIIEGEFNRPPMECDAQRLSVFGKVHQIGKDIGLDIAHGPSGGGSDASFTAAIGVPTLDGFGAVGDGAHAEHEHVIVSSLPERAALCAAVLNAYTH